MKSRLFRDRNLRVYAKKNEIKIKALRLLSEDLTLPFVLRHKIFLHLTQKQKWASLNRVKNRCLITQRSRGIFRLTKTSRLTFRKLATQGLLPGIRLATW